MIFRDNFLHEARTSPLQRLSALFPSPLPGSDSLEVSKLEAEELGERCCSALTTKAHSCPAGPKSGASGSLACHTLLSQQLVPETSWSPTAELSLEERNGIFS